jgi:succinate dehydrogenase/fumarate reductase-like Fe-S protein
MAWPVATYDRKWLFAQVNLAWRLIVHVARKLWPWAPKYGLQRFQENYVAEGLPPSSPDFRLLAHEPGRCTSCGRCDDACPLLRATAVVGVTDGFLGPMTFVLSGARSAPHLDDIKGTLATLTGPVCAGCKACDAACPERIPITKLAAVFEEQRLVVERARKGELPITDAKRALPPWVGRGG